MGKQTFSVESGNGDSDNGTAGSESEEVSEEEEPSEESVEEDPGDDEAQEDLGEDEEGSVEEDPEEEEQSEDAEEELSEDQPSGWSPVNGSYSRNKHGSSQPNLGKMNMPSKIAYGPTRISEPSGIQNPSNNKICAEQLVTMSNTGRKRHSRWDSVCEAKELTEASGSTAAKMGGTQGSGGSEKREKKKTRWSRWSNENPQISAASPLENPTVATEQESSNLKAQLLQIANELHYGVVDRRPESERSPSPPPIYNNLGMKINTREARLRAKLETQRQAIISELICKNPSFKPPPECGNNKLHKKIYIPTKEYPGYNFIGLIMGPRGNTHQRMEKDTGAKILLRGEGSCSKVKLGKEDPGDYEDLHVVVEADNRHSLDTAVAMVEKLLVPVEDMLNPHKLAQLKELVQIRSNTGNSRKTEPCNICGDVAHPTSACPLTAPAPGSTSAGHQANFFADMGGGFSSFSGPLLPAPATPPVVNSAAPVRKPKGEIDDANIYVCHLPQSVTETKLMELFSPFGQICQAKVAMDGTTGLSKGYGFVRYTDPVNAAKAVSQMNGYTIDGNMLEVRIAGFRPAPGNQPPTYPGPPVNQHPTYPGTPTYAGPLANLPPTYPGTLANQTSTYPTHPTHPGTLANQPSTYHGRPTHPGTAANQPPTYTGHPTYPGTSAYQLPTYPWRSAIPLNMNPDPMHWPGPPESRLPESVAPYFNRSTLPAHSGTSSGQFSASPAPSFQTPKATSLFSGDFAGSDELAHFPGYLKSLDSPSQPHHKSMPSSSLPPQVNISQKFGGYHMPPT